MCGLAGILTTRADRRAGLLGAVTRMRETLDHRGPDDAGAWQDAEAGIALGFRRLSILDLSPAGHQPLRSRGGRWVIAFNGEIYNHRALRGELAALGHAFSGHSDTEAILAAVEQGTPRSARPIRGMFRDRALGAGAVAHARARPARQENRFRTARRVSCSSRPAQGPRRRRRLRAPGGLTQLAATRATSTCRRPARSTGT
jgi:asparagine synthase (glutamine-hydrolysing)